MKFLNALTIAGTDPSGGAGIQADLKVFSALGAYGTSVITALLAQNTCGVKSIYHIKPDFVAEQLSSVFSDIRIDTVKIGMLAENAIIEVVADQLKCVELPFIVLDTVIVAKSGDILLSKEAIISMRELLFPQVSLITPNLIEAAMILGCSIATSEKEMLEQGDALLNLGCKAVLMKGGHLNHPECPDWLITCNDQQRFTSPRVNTYHTHGTGCSLSAALAALRPHQDNWMITVSKAKSWLYQSLLHADLLEVGKGRGPLHHFHQWW